MLMGEPLVLTKNEGELLWAQKKSLAKFLKESKTLLGGGLRIFMHLVEEMSFYCR